MFRLLLKHDWKSIRGILGLLCLICLGAGIVGGFALRFLIIAFDQPDPSAYQMVLAMGSVMACYAAIIICAAGTLFFCIWRFYKSRYADEGYMTFTLPATAHQILLSSMTATLLAMLCAFVAVFVSIFTAVFIGISAVEGAYTEMAQQSPMVWDAFWEAVSYEKSMFASLMFYVPVSGIAGIVIMMLSVTVGSVVARKLKFLAAIGIYYGIQVAVSLITSVLMVLTGVTATSSTTLLDHFFLYPTILMAALGIGAYFLMHRLASKKLNLP